MGQWTPPTLQPLVPQSPTMMPTLLSEGEHAANGIGDADAHSEAITQNRR